MFGISHHPFRCLDRSLHEGIRLAKQYLSAGDAIKRAKLGLEVPLEIFIGIDLWRAGRNIKDFDSTLPPPATR